MCLSERHCVCSQRIPARTAKATPEKPWPPAARPRIRRRVLYPPLVKRTVPGERPDPARRWLLALSLLLFLQIYTEEGARSPKDPARPRATSGSARAACHWPPRAWIGAVPALLDTGGEKTRGQAFYCPPARTVNC
ncbi:radiation-inducible immediate-early gene IEX-1-like [Denticeps clupeoides]|uniref:radiation-inducible immediate-early gene IEX-1-like n=1 Tax=Denticeps clupeoides TaxID=299321 RepID=UPI0010A3A6E4|nr:radiation-inducible immediate-early gene IEX-1-like [Denticeps clupeoides]